MTAAEIYTPAYVLDLCTVRGDGDDWNVNDLAVLMFEPQVQAAVVALHEMAGQPPTIVYVAGAAALRVYAARFRLAGRPSRFIESDTQAAEIVQATDDLAAGRLNVLVTRRPYQAGLPIPPGTAVLLARPTRVAESFLDFLDRLQAGPDTPIRLIDVAQNIERLGVPSGWDVHQVKGETPDVVYDPVVDRLSLMSGPQIAAWAEGNEDRLRLAAKARGFKSGWVEHARRGWLAKQVKKRTGPSRPEARAPP